MAYLMTDAAAGSTAALQMQQNVAAAPYAKDQAAAAAEETQLKLQQDRIKAQYAGQEAAVKLQQDQQTLAESQLRNTVLKNNLSSTADVKTAVNSTIETPEYKDAVGKNDWAGAGHILNQAMLKASGNVVEFNKNEANIALEAARSAQEAKRTSDLNAENLNRATVALKTMPEDRIESFISQLPKETTAAAIKAVGQSNWDNATPKEKREILMGQTLSGTAQIQAQKIDGLQATAKEVTKRVTTVANINAAAKIQAKTLGEDRKDDRVKADPLKATRADTAITRLFGENKRSIDNNFLREMGPLNKQLAELKSTSDQERLINRPSQATADGIARVEKQMQAVVKKQHDELEAAAKRLPESDAKNRALSELGIIAVHADSLSPTKKEPDERNSKGRKPDVVPSNKPAVSGLQSQVEASGQTYEPNKYDYRVAPDGSIQRKAK